MKRSYLVMVVIVTVMVFFAGFALSSFLLLEHKRMVSAILVIGCLVLPVSAFITRKKNVFTESDVRAIVKNELVKILIDKGQNHEA